jgi:hypothetical protein
MSDWQNIIVIVCIALAGGYLAARAWRVIAGTKLGGCGTCGSCESNQPSAKPFLSIESISRPDDATDSDRAI